MIRLLKKLHTCLLAASSLLAITACSEEEIDRFASERGINFLAWNSQQQKFEDDYTNLKSTINFYSYYLKGLDATEAKLKLGVMLEGMLSEQPVSVRFATLADKDYPEGSIILPNDSIIAPGEHQRSITVVCKRPATYDTEYRSILTFDYTACGLVPGTKERQQYTVILTDATDWTSMNVSNEVEWNNSYASTLGIYGPVKVRFIMAVLGAQYNYTATQINNLYYYTTSYPAYGFEKEMERLRTALQEYNSTHDVPLAEPDGTPVTFEPAAVSF